MTGQEADFDEGLDFDCFLVTGFLEEVAPSKARSASSNLRGLRESGFSLAMAHSTRSAAILTKTHSHGHIVRGHFLPLILGEEGQPVSRSLPTSAA